MFLLSHRKSPSVQSPHFHLMAHFDAEFRYSGIESVSFSQFEQQLSDYMVETLVSFARGSTPSWWPMYRSLRATGSLSLFFFPFV